MQKDDKKDGKKSTVPAAGASRATTPVVEVSAEQRLKEQLKLQAETELHNAVVIEDNRLKARLRLIKNAAFAYARTLFVDPEATRVQINVSMAMFVVS